MATLRMYIEGDQVVIANIQESAAAAMDLKPPFNMVADDMMRIEEQVFLSEGRRGGGSWKRLKPETIKRRERKGVYGTSILFATGELFDSLTERGARNQILNISRDKLEFGTTRPGAEKHQRGYPPQNIPARPFIEFTQFDINRWQEWIVKHLTRMFGTGSEAEPGLPNVGSVVTIFKQ